MGDPNLMGNQPEIPSRKSSWLQRITSGMRKKTGKAISAEQPEDACLKINRQQLDAYAQRLFPEDARKRSLVIAAFEFCVREIQRAGKKYVYEMLDRELQSMYPELNYEIAAGIRHQAEMFMIDIQGVG